MHLKSWIALLFHVWNTYGMLGGVAGVSSGGVFYVWLKEKQNFVFTGLSLIFSQAPCRLRTIGTEVTPWKELCFSACLAFSLIWNCQQCMNLEEKLLQWSNYMTWQYNNFISVIVGGHSFILSGKVRQGLNKLQLFPIFILRFNSSNNEIFRKILK